MESTALRIKGLLLDGKIAPDGQTATFGFQLPAGATSFFKCSARDLATITRRLGELCAALEQSAVAGAENSEPQDPTTHFEANRSVNRTYVTLRAFKKSGIRSYLTVRVNQIDDIVAMLQAAKINGADKQIP